MNFVERDFFCATIQVPMEKEKVPFLEALAVARQLVAILKPHCKQLKVAGSLRRRKEHVADIEILFVPKFGKESDPLDLYGHEHTFNLADRAIHQELLASGTLAPRLNKHGIAAWGDLNKLALHPASGIAVDLFTATERNWFNYLVCRTGSADNNIAIAGAAIARGWRWHPYGEGFSRESTREKRTMQSEEEVFSFVGLPYLEPWQR